jgi:hypothetical protein
MQSFKELYIIISKIKFVSPIKFEIYFNVIS